MDGHKYKQYSLRETNNTNVLNGGVPTAIRSCEQPEKFRETRKNTDRVIAIIMMKMLCEDAYKDCTEIVINFKCGGTSDVNGDIDPNPEMCCYKHLAAENPLSFVT